MPQYHLHHPTIPFLLTIPRLLQDIVKGSSLGLKETPEHWHNVDDDYQEFVFQLLVLVGNSKKFSWWLSRREERKTCMNEVCLFSFFSFLVLPLIVELLLVVLFLAPYRMA